MVTRVLSLSLSIHALVAGVDVLGPRRAVFARAGILSAAPGCPSTFMVRNRSSTARRLEVVAEGLAMFGGVQLATDGNPWNKSRHDEWDCGRARLVVIVGRWSRSAGVLALSCTWESSISPNDPSWQSSAGGAVCWRVLRRRHSPILSLRSAGTQARVDTSLRSTMCWCAR